MSRTGRLQLITPENEAKTADFLAYRERHGLGALAAVIEDALDLRAGPHALTEQERDDRAACRERFGIYDPANGTQATFLRRRRAQRLVAA